MPDPAWWSGGGASSPITAARCHLCHLPATHGRSLLPVSLQTYTTAAPGLSLWLLLQAPRVVSFTADGSCCPTTPHPGHRDLPVARSCDQLLLTELLGLAVCVCGGVHVLLLNSNSPWGCTCSSCILHSAPAGACRGECETPARDTPGLKDTARRGLWSAKQEPRKELQAERPPQARPRRSGAAVSCGWHPGISHGESRVCG